MLAGYPQVEIKLSKGFMKGGTRKWFIRPAINCFNRSRIATTLESAEKMAKKWYSPTVQLYSIGGREIGSNNPENALKEYWRVCEMEEISKPLEVTLIQPKPI